MPNEEEIYQQQMQEQIQQNALMDAQLTREQMSQVQQSRMMEQQELNMASEQLNIEKDLENLTNLLRGKIPVRNQDGEIEWKNPNSNDEVLLTEEGINLIMNTVRFYVNKNTLLSNYDDDMINWKMEDFATSLADALFMNYEKYFLYPIPEDVEKKLIARLERKKQDIIATCKLRNQEYDEKVIWNNLVAEINPTIERIKIREQIIKDKLKGYDLLLRKVQDFVHSSYLRAWKGQERSTMRQHWHISESRTPNFPQQKTGGIFGFFKK